MSRDEVIFNIRNSVSFKENNYRKGYITVRTKPNEKLDKLFGNKVFNLWGVLDHMGCVWGFCGKEIGEIPKLKEFKLIQFAQQFNWFNELELASTEN